MTDTVPTPAPAVLGEHGAALWDRLLTHLTFDAHELVILATACGMADKIAALDAAVAEDGYMVTSARGARRVHPAIAESRQLALAQARIFVALRVPQGYSTGQAHSGPLRQAQRRGMRGVQQLPRSA